MALHGTVAPLNRILEFPLNNWDAQGPRCFFRWGTPKPPWAPWVSILNWSNDLDDLGLPPFMKPPFLSHFEKVSVETAFEIVHLLEIEVFGMPKMRENSW